MMHSYFWVGHKPVSGTYRYHSCQILIGFLLYIPHTSTTTSTIFQVHVSCLGIEFFIRNTDTFWIWNVFHVYMLNLHIVKHYLIDITITNPYRRFFIFFLSTYPYWIISNGHTPILCNLGWSWWQISSSILWDH